MLQLPRLSYRGEPLTEICRRAILGTIPDSSVGEEYTLLQAKAQLALLQVAQNNADFKRYKEIGGTF